MQGKGSLVSFESKNVSNEIATVSVPSDTRLETIERTVEISGMRDIMFDRYAGDNDTKLSWTEKIYLVPGTNKLCLPASNINSFFTAHNTPSAPKRLREARKFKKICDAIQSFTMIESLDAERPEYIQFYRDGEPVTVGKFDEAYEPESGIYLHRSVARLDKGIPNPKERPVLPRPWSLKFKITIFRNNMIKEAEIRNLLIDGGVAVGLGTYRGQFGKFAVTQWF